MLENYFAVLVFIAVGILFGVLPMIMGALLGPRDGYPEKTAPYECGFPAFEDARMPFDVRFYLVAILFIVFDLETAFLFPWGVSLRDIGWPGFVSMAVFLGELVLGFVYLWKMGALEWE